MAGYTTGMVVGSIVQNGVPCSGTVVFTPNDPAVTSALNISTGLPRATVASDGTFSASVPATDDTSLSTDDWSYEVTFDLANNVLNGVMFTVKVPGNTQVSLNGLPENVEIIPGVRYESGPPPPASWVGDQLVVGGAEGPHLTGQMGPQGVGNVVADTDGVPYWASTATLRGATILASGSNTADLNTITTPGVYYQSSSSGPTTALNYPQQPFAGLIEVFSNGSSMTEQRATYYDSNAAQFGIWTRTKYSSYPWSAWAKQPQASDVNTVQAQVTLLTGTNSVVPTTSLDALTTPGAYYLTGSQAVTGGMNVPVQAAGEVEVIAYTPSYVTQRFTTSAGSTFTQGVVYSRSLWGGAWSRWQQLAIVGAPGGSDLTGTGSPVGVITPASAGIYYTDTAGTCGAWRWLSTGTTNTSWIVDLGDTGWRNIASLIDSTQWSISVALLRRQNNVVTFIFRGSSANTWNAALYSTVTGWQPKDYTSHGTMGYLAALYGVGGFGSRQVISLFPIAGASTSVGANIAGEVSWFCEQAWPTALIGTAA